jgi:hypothetical protein
LRYKLNVIILNYNVLLIKYRAIREKYILLRCNIFLDNKWAGTILYFESAIIYEPFAKLGFLFKIKACKKFYHRRPVGSALGVQIIDIGVEVYARRVLTSGDKILSITQSLGR